MLQDLLHAITIFITGVLVTVTSALPHTATNINKPADISIASPSALISASPSASPTIKPTPKVIYTKKPTPIPTTTPSSQPSRVSVLLVNDGTTVLCLSEWADEVKRASQGVKDAEEWVNKLSDCMNSCSSTSENARTDCRTKYPTPPGPGGLSPPEQIACTNKVRAERANCLSSCPGLSSLEDHLNLYSNREKSKKFLSETRGEHCTDSK